MMPVSVARAKTLIGEFCAVYPAALDVQYLVRETQEEAFHENATIERFGPLLGAYFPARRYAAFATANFRDENEFKQTLRHEVLGHFGINTFTADEKRAVLKAIVEAREQPGLATLWAQVDKVYPDTSELRKAEEVYAFACETVTPQQLINEADGQKALREICIDQTRPMRLQDLVDITAMVANGLSDRTRSLQNFPLTDDDQFRRAANVAIEGAHIGKVLDALGGVVVQRTGRNGEEVRHLAARLSEKVEVGDIVEIRYENGLGIVGGRAAKMERGR